jgi:glycosyltransferase involved in cell wall biosynthesis
LHKKDNLTLSVIIPTRNRADFLEIALESIGQQSASKDRFETLVIDNGSTDHTRAVVDKIRGKISNLKYFHEPQPGLHSGRHRGLRESMGDVLVYADDDIRAMPSWLSTLSEVFADPRVAMAGGNNYPDFLGAVPAWLERLWARPVYGGQMIGQLSILSLPEGRREMDPLLVWGCNFSIRRQVLLDAGGFHPDAMPKEHSWFRGDGETHVSQYVKDNGLRCIFDSGASVYHAVTPERMTIAYFRQRAFNQGISDSYTALRKSSRPSRVTAWMRLSRMQLAKRLRGLLGREFENSVLEQVNAEQMRGYIEGFRYHQRLYFEMPEVRDWVDQPNYW